MTERRHLLARFIGFALLIFGTAGRAEPNPEPFPVAAGKKGLQVQMIDDALALGIQHATLNVDLARLPAFSPRRDDLRWEAADGLERAYDARAVESLDRQVTPLSDAGVTVYLILLCRESGETERDKVMLHPRYDRAAKTNRMSAFNTATPEGAGWLKATVEFLAYRYSQPSSLHGRVWGYIVGNEVNSHWWYNLGRAPVEKVAEEYESAVRVVHESVRRHSRHARIYLSFEHHWGIRYPAGTEEQSVPGRDLLEAFARCARDRGDFDWHVAFHPYPENLGDARTWLDKSATPSPDTARITFKNLEILPAWLARSELLWDGKPRRVILSEQGFHCREDSPDGERLQAAAFCYAWQKVSVLEGIDAFILHRHVDHAHEGLNLGLWTHQPETVSTPGRQRILYQVFRAAGTSEWQKASAFAPSVMGQEVWDRLQQ